MIVFLEPYAIATFTHWKNTITKCRMIERERDWHNAVDDCIYRCTDLEAKKALLEIWQEINYT
jgi:hypothetical protein